MKTTLAQAFAVMMIATVVCYQADLTQRLERKVSVLRARVFQVEHQNRVQDIYLNSLLKPLQEIDDLPRPIDRPVKSHGRVSQAGPVLLPYWLTSLWNTEA